VSFRTIGVIGLALIVAVATAGCRAGLAARPAMNGTATAVAASAAAPSPASQASPAPTPPPLATAQASPGVAPNAESSAEPTKAGATPAPHLATLEPSQPAIALPNLTRVEHLLDAADNALAADAADASQEGNPQ
jgi:hypothetical protein